MIVLHNYSICSQKVVAQVTTNNEIQVLLTDTIDDLKTDDMESANIHLKLIQKQLSRMTENSSSTELATILVNDTLRDLQRGDVNSALIHIDLTRQQLAMSPPTMEGNQTAPPKAPQAETQSYYNLTVGNETFSIKYQLINGTLDNIKPVIDQASLLLNISSNEDGRLEIDLPRRLIDSKGQTNTDEEFAVFADGLENFANEVIKNNKSRTLDINFEKGVESLEIVGTQMLQPIRTSIAQTNETAANQGIAAPKIDENETASQPTEFLTFESSDPDVKMKYPSNWVAGGPNVSESITIINSFYSPEIEDYAVVTIGVDHTYRAHSQLNDFQSDVIGSYTMYPEYFPDFKLDYSSTNNATLSDRRAYLIEGRYNDPGFGIQKVMEIGTILGNKGYFVQYIASPALYSYYLPIVRQMLDSVEIVSSTATGSEVQTQTQATEEQVPQETSPPEPQDTTINVYLDTHIYTVRDQPIKIRIWNPEQSDYQWRTLTVPSSGGIVESFTVPDNFIPEGYGFMVCVTNERNGKEDCRQALRERGSGQTDVFITVP